MTLKFTIPITEIIRRRSSCRSYAAQPLDPAVRLHLQQLAGELGEQLDGNRIRFELAATDRADLQELRQLGTYGFIRGASAFLIAIIPEGFSDLEGLGAQMEKWVLEATSLDLGTCWLGGTFSKSSFARKAGVGQGELIPAVIACGYPAGGNRSVDRLIRSQAGSDRRLAWKELFFAEKFGQPLPREAAGDFAVPLEMVRLAPSASNKQPWRIERLGQSWHFFVQRTPGYRDGILNRIFTQTDLQRIDLGIGMCHFELTSQELGLRGGWADQDPGIHPPGHSVEYIRTWVENPD